jgi:soluble lytic murein transglycosylase-like protein
VKAFLAILGVVILVLWFALRSTRPMSASQSPYADIIQHASNEFNVPPDWIAAVISTESAWNPEAYAPGEDSYGLMQVRYVTAKGLGFSGDANELFDPDLNIHLGTKLLGQLRQHYGDDLQRVYSAYNSGDPDAYKTSKQVAQHVQNFLDNYRSITT